MDEQNNSEVDNTKLPPQNLSSQPLNQGGNVSTPTSAPKAKRYKYLVPTLIGAVIILLLIGGLYLFKNNRSVNKTNPTNTQQQTTPAPSNQKAHSSSNLDTLYAQIKSTYNGNIPWTNINNRAAYKFYPKEIKGLTLANGEVDISSDTDFNPLTIFPLSETVQVPLKNSYISLFQVPDVLMNKFHLSDEDIAFPLKLQLYEFDRKLSKDEVDIFTKGENFSCRNDKAKTEKDSFVSPQLIVYYCNANLTEEQKVQAKGEIVFDKIYEIYFVDRNILILFSVNGEYVSNPEDYLFDYMIKLFNSNDNLFIKQSQITSLEESRKFEEWRSKTFDGR